MRLIVFLLTVLLFPLPASAVTRVLGAAVLGPSELLGLCVAPKILNLVDAGALATGIDGSTRSGFKAGGYENVGAGTGYLVASNATIVVSSPTRWPDPPPSSSRMT